MNPILFEIVLLCVTFISFTSGHLALEWEPRNPPFDPNFYKELLDSELCQEQLSYISNDPVLLAQFVDSGLRIPKGITEGNLEDWGNYHQCLAINRKIDSTIEGKFCFIDVPVNQNIEFPIRELSDWIDFNPNKLKINNDTVKYIQQYNDINEEINVIYGMKQSMAKSAVSQIQTLTFKLAVCVPKPCTTQEVINGLFNFTDVGFQYNDRYCRVKHDKLWAPVDYILISIFTFLGLFTLFSTSYDIWHSICVKTDPKSVNSILKLFSLYTNSRQLLTFTSSSSTVECLDGIRAISMMWIIIGHTFLLLPQKQNLIYFANYALSINSLWVTAAPIAVDTFFMLSGLLLVYTTANKMTAMKLLRNLHVFYLNRLFRMFPLLATGVLFQASIFHWISDGPVWDTVAIATQNCRTYWWTTLLYVQNYIKDVESGLCLGQTWYLAVDMQMYILSPLLLFWVLGRSKSTAWIALSCALIAILASSTIYIFINELPSALVTANDGITNPRYVQLYYYNTLNRGAAFVVGMLFGYLLHVYRGKKVKMSKRLAVLLWIAAFAITTITVYSNHPVKKDDWDNRTVDGLINSFSRPLWTLSLGWMIFACHYGYGGPINWILSLQMWKLPSRLSYGMYIFHVPIMLIVASSAVAPVYFSVTSSLYRFFSDLFVSFVVSFMMTVFVDSPFSNLIKRALGGGQRKPKELKKDNALPKQNMTGPSPNKYIKNYNNEYANWDMGVVNNRFLKNSDNHSKKSKNRAIRTF